MFPTFLEKIILSEESSWGINRVSVETGREKLLWRTEECFDIPICSEILRPRQRHKNVIRCIKIRFRCSSAQKHDNKWLPRHMHQGQRQQQKERCANIEGDVSNYFRMWTIPSIYIYKQSIQVATDDKPLEAIFKKSLSDCPIKIQRLMLRLQKDILDVSYTPGKFIHTADALSKAHLQTPCSGDVSNGPRQLSNNKSSIVR